jgi:hypothetical protein
LLELKKRLILESVNSRPKMKELWW